MKKQLILIYAILVSSLNYAQITTEILDPIIYEDLDLNIEFDVPINIRVKNISSDTINLKWEIKRDIQSCEADWGLSHYDYNLCYIESVTSNVDPDIGLNNPVVMPPEFEYDQKLVIYPNQVEGCCSYSFAFSDADDPEMILAITELPVQINQEDCFTFTDENTLDDLQVFPNPFSRHINLKNGADVKSVKIFDLKGQLVSNPIVLNNSIQGLEQLSSGLYLLTLYSDIDVPLKTIKIVKE